jgi:hypothetical protein
VSLKNTPLFMRVTNLRSSFLLAPELRNNGKKKGSFL